MPTATEQSNNLWHKFYRLYLKVWRVLLSLVLIASAAGIYFFFFNNETAKAGWWNDQWLYRKALVVDHSEVAGDLTNFPVLVSLTDTDFIGKAQDDGGDFVFIDNHGEKLKHEIEGYASSTGVLVAWVKIPALSSTHDASIYVYYGNASVQDQESPTGVWDENYNGVWHMDSAESATDSTANGRTGTVNSATATSSGKIGPALNFSGGGGETDIAAVTVSTSTNNTMTASSYQRKTWYDGSRFWVAFHDDAENRIEFWYSEDGLTWNENTTGRLNYDYNRFSLEADSDNAFMFVQTGIWPYVMQASSTTNYPGTAFSWNIGPHALSMGTKSNIQKDSNGLVWYINNYSFCMLGTCNFNNFTGVSSLSNDISSFTETTLYSTEIGGETSESYAGLLVPLANGDMYGIWKEEDDGSSDRFYGKKYSSGWDASPTEIDSIKSGSSYAMQAVSSPDDDEAYLIYINSAGNTMFQKYIDGSGWTGTTTLSGNTTNSYPAISIDRVNNNKLYAFWVNNNIIYMKTADAPYTSWSATTTIYDTGTNLNLTSIEEASGGYIALTWTEGASTPYSVKFYGVSTGGGGSVGGSGDYVDVGNNGNAKTVSFWVNAASTTEKIVNLNSTAYIEVADGTINAQGFSSPTVYVDGQETTSLSTGWHYVTVTASTAVDATSTEFGKIGEEYFTGVLDEVRLSGVGRSSSWIETEYNNQSDPASFFVVQAEEKGPGPVGSWSFDEGSGAAVYDGSGQGNNGAITGAVWKDEDECVSGKCLYFDGSGDKVTIQDIDL